MGKNNAKVIIQTRSSFNRRRVKDRRSFLKRKYLDHNHERRVNIFKRRMFGDRRRVFPEIINTFWEEDS